VGAGDSGLRSGGFYGCDPQGRPVAVGWAEGCTSPALCATNRWLRNEDPGEVCCSRVASPGLLSLRPTGT
jgi:hypothetical protein